MNFKIFMLLFVFAMNATVYANATTLIPTPAEDGVQVESISIVLEVDAESLDAEHVDLENLLSPILDGLEDEATCTLTLKVKFGTSGTGVEASITIEDDCETIMEMASEKLKELKSLIYR